MTTVDPRADLSALHGPDGIGAEVPRRPVRLADEAAHHRAAAHHDGAGDVPRRAGRPRPLAGRRDARRRHALSAARPTPSTATSTATSTRSCTARATGRWSPATISPARRSRLRRRARPSRSTLWFGLLVNWLRRLARPRRDALLRRRLHDAAQAPHRAEHRVGRRGRLHAGAHRLVGRHRLGQLVGRSSSSSSSSSGRRRTTGRCRCASRTTTPRAHVPMLPVVERFVVVARQIVAYSWAMVAASLALVPGPARSGWVYTVAAVVTGALFLAEAHRLLRAAKAGRGGRGRSSRCGCSTSRSPT